MGCSICQGHAHQVCGAPGCHDENEDLRREAAERDARQFSPTNYDDRTRMTRDAFASADRWRALSQEVCGVCGKAAAYTHPVRGFRCSSCPRYG